MKRFYRNWILKRAVVLLRKMSYGQLSRYGIDDVIWSDRPITTVPPGSQVRFPEGLYTFNSSGLVGSRTSGGPGMLAESETAQRERMKREAPGMVNAYRKD